MPGGGGCFAKTAASAMQACMHAACCELLPAACHLLCAPVPPPTPPRRAHAFHTHHTCLPSAGVLPAWHSSQWGRPPAAAAPAPPAEQRPQRPRHKLRRQRGRGQLPAGWPQWGHINGGRPERQRAGGAGGTFRALCCCCCCWGRAWLKRLCAGESGSPCVVILGL